MANEPLSIDATKQTKKRKRDYIDSQEYSRQRKRKKKERKKAITLSKNVSILLFVRHATQIKYTFVAKRCFFHFKSALHFQHFFYFNPNNFIGSAFVS
jgi:hypothetical protein